MGRAQIPNLPEVFLVSAFSSEVVDLAEKFASVSSISALPF